MIINFSVQNYGSIKDKQTLSFEADKSTHLEDYYVIHTNGLRLLKLGLIYGANASGKTTILKALDFLRTLVLNPKSQKTETFDFDPFLFDENTPNQNTIFEIEFLQNDVRYFYFVELNKKAIVSEELYAYNPKKSNVFKRTTNLEKQTTDIQFGNKIKIDKISERTLVLNTLWNRVVLDGFNRTNVDIKELKDGLDWFKDYLQQLIVPHKDLTNFTSSRIVESEIQKNIVIEILKKADFNISNIIIKNKEYDYPVVRNLEDQKALIEWQEWKQSMGFKEIKFEHTINDKRYVLAFEKESQGTQRYYGLAGILYLLIKNSAAFSIDELESSLHPDLFEHFLLSFLINSKKSQLLATTHNREILEDKDIFRNDAIWITNKEEDSATELYSFADFNTSVIRNTNSIYNAYKIGKLGGVPNLGDYYIDIEDESN
ncbi:MAG: ATP-binding protein [Candidatus Symbiothrix sp.]|jgi:AAA15 family ATPase/GTPase|nr:ATP-binding protein [Candidatus Symbiothrix sp.]